MWYNKTSTIHKHGDISDCGIRRRQPYINTAIFQVPNRTGEFYEKWRKDILAVLLKFHEADETAIVTVAIVTVAIVTVAIVTVAIVTVAIVTVAIVTVAIVTVAIATVAIVTVAIVTVAVVTVAIVTVAIVTVAIVTVAIVTVAISMKVFNKFSLNILYHY